MANTGRWVTGGVTLAVVLAGPCAAAAATQQPALVLRIDNHAQVPAPDLASARREVERVFRGTGVEIAWADGPTPAPGGEPDRDRRLVVVTLVDTGQKPAGGAAGCALGVAVRARDTALIFYNRIVDTSLTGPIDVNVVLGRVIAHEVGHLLLPPGSHAAYGIMRPDLDLGTVNPNRFTDDQVRAIRAGLMARSAQD